MADINQNVNINVNANTQDAGQDISRLEQNIKTLDGAVNLVGGSIATLAGGLALTGAVTDEQAERFQAAAVGAIALAEGSKRALEGFKTLATETKVLTTVQRIYNAVLNANPIFLIAGVLVTATIALVAWTSATNKQATSAELAAEATEQQKNALADLNKEQKFALELARARGASQEELLELELENAKAQAQALTDARIKQYTISRFSEETTAAYAAEEEALGQLKLAEERLATFRINESARQAEAARKAAEAREKERLANTNFSENTINLKRKEVATIVDTERQGAQMSVSIASQASLERFRLEKQAADRRKAIAQQEEAYKQALLTDGIDNIQGALSALFGENKAIASANVLIDAAQAGVAIIKNSQTTGPFAIAYQVTQFALLAATTIASLRQINAAEPGASGTPSFPKGGGIPASGGFGGMQTGGGGQVTVTPNTGFSAPPIRAYVVTGDVVTGMEAEAQLTTRRQFP